MPIRAVAAADDVLDLGHRIPAIATPGKIAAQVARLSAGPAPLVSPEQLEALLRKLADRYMVARKDGESGKAVVVAMFHRGQHVEFRWNGDDVVRNSP